MSTESNSTRRLNGSDDSLGQIGVLEANVNGAFAVSRDILVSVWRRPPNVVEMERLCSSLERVVRHADGAGFWLITAAGCRIPSVAVRRLMAERLRTLSKLHVFAVSVEAMDSDGALMRAALRSTAVAGGIRSAHFGKDVASVAAYLSEVLPLPTSQWGERVARILRHASDEIAGTGLGRVLDVVPSLHVVPD